MVISMCSILLTVALLTCILVLLVELCVIVGISGLLGFFLMTLSMLLCVVDCCL